MIEALIECRLSGQIDYAQWEEHCADTPGLAEAYTAHKAANGIPLTRAERGVVLPGEAPLDLHDALTWCAATLQGVIPVNEREGRIRRIDTDAVKTINQVLDLADSALAAAPAQQAGAPPQERPHALGCTVSVDVSTGDQDAGHRIFAKVGGMQQEENGEWTLLAEETSRNFAASTVAGVPLPPLPQPTCTYADHSYPAFTKGQMTEYGHAARAGAPLPLAPSETGLTDVEVDAMLAKSPLSAESRRRRVATPPQATLPASEAEMRAILQDLHDKFNTRVYGTGSYIKRDMRDRIAAVLATTRAQPQADAAPSGASLQRLIDVLTKRKFRAPALVDELLMSAANIISEDGTVIDHLMAKPQADAAEPVALTDEERQQLAVTIEEFIDTEQTMTDYPVLLDWAARGLLECTHFVPTEAGRAAAAQAPGAREQAK